MAAVPAARPASTPPTIAGGSARHSYTTAGDVTEVASARGRNRTGTTLAGLRILSPLRLPVPPSRHRYIFNNETELIHKHLLTYFFTQYTKNGWMQYSKFREHFSIQNNVLLMKSTNKRRIVQSMHSYCSINSFNPQ